MIRDLVIFYWESSGHPAHSHETIIPKGVTEVIIRLSDQPVLIGGFNQESSALPQCFIWGFNSKPIRLVIPGYQHFLGIQLHPFAVRHLFGLISGELRDQVADLEYIDPAVRTLRDRLMYSGTFAERVSLIEKWLVSRLGNNCVQPRLKKISHYLYEKPESNVSSAKLSEKLFYSSRQLSRKFYELTGMNTEETLLYKKYLQSLNLIHSTDQSMTEIAYASHFSDQSHLIKTFKMYSELTPGEYKRIKSNLPGHLYS